MRSEARLESAVFQLTPTRTRCELLVVIANGKTEKIASGLVNPFLSHLKSAQEQIAKGGYSIKLETDPASDAWFTKGTLERFVRFVSTPEVLERVSTIESEISQIEEAVLIQGNNNLGLSSVNEHHLTRLTASSEGSKPIVDVDAEKAIVLYKPGTHTNPPESNVSKMNEENSKVQLLRVLQSRKKVLQKEQAMAFARAAAAGFDMDNMTNLIAFSKSFGASRLMEACIHFMQLWKRKHENGQWIEVEAAEALSYRSEFSSLKNSGIFLSGDPMKQKELAEAWPVSGGDNESNGNAGNQVKTEFNAHKLSSGLDKERRLTAGSHVTTGRSEHYQGQFPQPPFPEWTLHSKPGPNVIQPYSMQPMPYYPNYPGNSQFFHPPYPPIEDRRFTDSQKMGKKKHSANSSDFIFTSEDTDESISEPEEEVSRDRSSHRKHGRSEKKKGVVVVRNLNYIAAKRHEIAGNGSEESFSDTCERQKSLGSPKGKDNHKRSQYAHGTEKDRCPEDADAGNWQAFQNFLLRAEEKMTGVLQEDIFAGEKEPPTKKNQKKGIHDPLLSVRDPDNNQEQSFMEFDANIGQASRTKHAVSRDVLITSNEKRDSKDRQTVALSNDIEGRTVGYRKASSDAFIIYGREKQKCSKISSNCQERNSEKCSSHNLADESFIVPFRSGSQDQLGADKRLTVVMDSELLSAPQRNEDSSIKASARTNYAPDDLALMLECNRESECLGFDPANDYYIQVPFVVKKEIGEDVYKEGLKKTVKEKKLRSPQDEIEKKRKDAIVRKMASSRSTTLTEAQKRAEKLRNYKADLQKLKKEQEEQEIRRLDALKRERQRRIVARSGSSSVQSPMTSQQPKPRLPVRVSPTSYKSSKFTDSETRTNSQLQMLSRRTSSIGSNGFDKATKTLKSNGLSHSASSLHALKKVEKQENAASAQIRRLSEPKRSIVHNTPIKSANIKSSLHALKEAEKQENTASARIRKPSEPKCSTVHNNPVKSANTNQIWKKILSEEPHFKKISAITKLDKTKSEMLPELRIKACRTSSEADQDIEATKQHKGAGRTSVINESKLADKNVEHTTSLSCSDDNPMIEKTVVILDNEVIPAPILQTSEGKIDMVDQSNKFVKREKAGEDIEFVATPSPIDIAEIENPSQGSQGGCLNSYEIVNNSSKDESQKISDPTDTHRQPYHASCARASFLEDPFTDLSSLDLINETRGKPRNKESKGLRKLWKFGRKDHTSGSGEVCIDSDGTVDDNTMATSNNSMLKSLISQDETHSGGSTSKVARHLSILSPFRGKTNAKKVAG